MESINSLEEILDEIQTQEGEGFLFEKENIEEVIQNKEVNTSNLAVKILSAFGGIFGSIFFTAFLLISGIAESETGMLLFGIMFTVGSIVMGRVDKSFFFDTINISCWLIGIAFLGGGIGAGNMNEDLIPWIFLVVGIATFALVRRYMLQFLSVLLVVGSLVTLILIHDFFIGIHFLIFAIVIALVYLHLNEAQVISKNQFFNTAYQPLRMGLIFSFIGILILIGKGGRMMDFYFNNLWISSLAIIVANLFSIYKIMEGLHLENSKIKTIVLVLSGLILLPAFFAPFIAGAILILLLNYHLGYRAGIVIGVIALIYAVNQYYYDLNFTLLEKSGILFISGLLFLAAYFIINQQIQSDEKL